MSVEKAIKALDTLTGLVKAVDAVYKAKLDWDTKFDLIFMNLAPEIRKLLDFDYYDPDMGYEDDVKAYYNALMEKCGGLLED